MRLERPGRMVLGLYATYAYGHHPSAWRHSGSGGATPSSLSYFTHLARCAEEALLDFIFLADTPSVFNDERGEKTINSKKAIFARGVGRYTEVLGGDNVLTWNGSSLTQSTWDDWLLEATKYGSNNKMLVCSGSLFRKIHSFGETKERIKIGENMMGNRNRALGIHYMNYTTAEGKVLKMLRHPGIEQGLEGWGQIIDLPFLEVPSFGKHKLFEYHEEVNDPSLAGKSNEFWFIGTVVVRRPEVNALIKVA